MRVVTGTVVSSSRVSLSKAAVILARFADADTAAPLEVAAYVRRASAAFDELADFHQEIKLSRKRAESETYKEEHSEEEKKKKKKRKRGAEGEERSNLSDGGIAKREIGVGGDGNLVMENERRKKKRKEAKEDERYGFEVKEENNGRVEEERHEERKKKKKKKKGDLDEEERYTYKKNKNYLDIGKQQGELVDQSEQHKKKKKRKKSEAED